MLNLFFAVWFIHTHIQHGMNWIQSKLNYAQCWWNWDFYTLGTLRELFLSSHLPISCVCVWLYLEMLLYWLLPPPFLVWPSIISCLETARRKEGAPSNLLCPRVVFLRSLFCPPPFTHTLGPSQCFLPALYLIIPYALVCHRYPPLIF